MSVQNVLALPDWEIEGWKSVFEVFGPLDWERQDLENARLYATQIVSEKGKRVDDFLLFTPLTKRNTLTEDDVLKALGFGDL